MLRYLFPRIAWSDFPPIVAATLIGGLIAGVYGIAHDQITYSISPEYFTKLKFQQFHYADFGWGERAFVATIGFLASWWVGAIIAWFLARRLIPQQPRRWAYRQIAAGFALVIVCGVVTGALAYAYGWWRGPNGNYAAWQWAIDRFGITDTWSFVRVAYIHNGSYLGGALGLVLALVLIRPQRDVSQSPVGEIES